MIKKNVMNLIPGFLNPSAPKDEKGSRKIALCPFPGEYNNEIA